MNRLSRFAARERYALALELDVAWTPAFIANFRSHCRVSVGFFD